jgi:hypothetical protein
MMGAFVRGVQETGGLRLKVDSRAYAEAQAGQRISMALFERLNRNEGWVETTRMLFVSLDSKTAFWSSVLRRLFLLASPRPSDG